MHGNIANGGLIVKFGNKNIVSDFNKLWFMNTDDEFVYYSDGTRGRFLYRYNESDTEGSAILKKPCTNLVLSGEWLYYINESDHRVYRCLRSGRSESLILQEEVSEFVMIDNHDMIYASETGDLASFGEILAKGVHPCRLCIANGKVFYADGSNNFFLTALSLAPNNNRVQCVGDIIPTSLNSYGQYIYFTDALKGNAIYRLHTEGEVPDEICEESAGYLHVIDEKLFYWNGLAWKHISL